MSEHYDTDFYTWTQEQAALLDARQFDTLDLPNLVEEILSLGINHKHALASHLRNLLLHLLKWHSQPHRRQAGRSWQSSISNARDEIALLLESSPSLEREIPALLTRRYPGARRRASRETRLPLETFPVACPWTVEKVLDEDFWPEPAP